jgi:hypothetical protein
LQRRFLSLAFMAAFVAVCLVACSGEGEGQRCSSNDDFGGPANNPHPAGSSDCSGDNICWPASALGNAAAQYAASGYDPSLGICCPVNRYSTDTVTICATSPSPPGGDAAPPADSGGSETGSESDAGDAAVPRSDAQADAETDAQTGAQTDAEADAAQADAQTDAETDAGAIADAGPG